MKCVICKEKVDPENPFIDGGVYEINPLTFRAGWSHGYCLQNAIGEMKTQPAKKPIQFESRYDEYIEQIQNTPNKAST